LKEDKNMKLRDTNASAREAQRSHASDEGRNVYKSRVITCFIPMAVATIPKSSGKCT
jgi:hypothetical protein